MKKKPYGKGKKWRIRGRKKTTIWERGAFNPSHYIEIIGKIFGNQDIKTSVTSTKL